MGSLGITMALEEGLQLVPIPVVASLASGAMSFVTTKLFHHSFIASMENSALTVLDIEFSEASTKDI